MKKYIFEATKKQWEKPTEPKQHLCADAKVTVCAENEAEALELAKKKFVCKYLGTGTILGEIRLVDCIELPVDWNYGYGDDRKEGKCDDKCALRADCTL